MSHAEVSAYRRSAASGSERTLVSDLSGDSRSSRLQIEPCPPRPGQTCYIFLGGGITCNSIRHTQ